MKTITKITALCGDIDMHYFNWNLYYAVINSNIELEYKDICQFCLNKLNPELVEDIKFHLILKKLKGKK